MNSLVIKSLLPPLRATRPCQIQILKQCHSTFMLTDTVSNDNDRLRAGEELYCNEVSTSFKQPYKSILDTLYKETENNFRNPHMMVSQVQAKVLHQLIGLLRPRQVLEIGGFTGYSAIAMGSALLPNAKLLSLELDPTHIAMAKRHVDLANLQDKIEFKEGPAGDSLIDLANIFPRPKYDFVFLDADKGGYITYFDLIMKHDMLSDHGVIVADNVLYYGQVHKQAANYKEDSSNLKTVEGSKNIRKTAAKLHAFNKYVYQDPRVEVVVLPIFDGISLIRKRVAE